MVKILDVATGNEIAVLQANAERVRCVAMSPDGKTVAAATPDLDKRGMVLLWDVATGKQLPLRQ